MQFRTNMLDAKGTHALTPLHLSRLFKPISHWMYPNIGLDLEYLKLKLPHLCLNTLKKWNFVSYFSCMTGYCPIIKSHFIYIVFININI